MNVAGKRGVVLEQETLRRHRSFTGSMNLKLNVLVRRGMNILSVPLVLAKAIFDIGLGTAAALSLSKGAVGTTVRQLANC
jgi:hypothetical protein